MYPQPKTGPRRLDGGEVIGEYRWVNDQSLGLVASAGVDETRGWSLRRNRSRSSSEVERADGSADLGRERVNGSVVHAAVWLADHYEVAAFYHAMNHEFLGPLEEALRQVLGVY